MFYIIQDISINFSLFTPYKQNSLEQIFALVFYQCKNDKSVVRENIEAVLILNEVISLPIYILCKKKKILMEILLYIHLQFICSQITTYSKFWSLRNVITFNSRSHSLLKHFLVSTFTKMKKKTANVKTANLGIKLSLNRNVTQACAIFLLVGLKILNSFKSFHK